ncbi:hypothetical protein [Lichenibacterium dinghuense]|uniref:hypothetical protein n=1 Tax=Lichenibacterium dinghuense TaxID=2895977 RepID=UPI001F17E724|nr:hypothetical protein [Lichenibacterium sp. 6Y81]
MPRPRLPAHAVWRADRGHWCIADGRDRIRIEPALTSPGPADEAAAQLAVARYVVEKADAAARTAAPQTDRDLMQVSIAEVLDRYLERRESGKKPCARLNEAKQRVAKLIAFFKEEAVAFVTESTCEDFASWCGSDSYARRCLADLQAALNEARRAALFRTPVLVTLPPPPAPSEDHLTFAEAVALVLTAWRHRDSQQRRVGGTFQRVDGKRKLIGGKLEEVGGSQRPWAHVGRFIVVAIATCSRSSRVYEASYAPEPGRPWVDLQKGVLYRQAPGTKVTKKKAPTIDLSPRLVSAMRRWSSPHTVRGREVPGDRYVVQMRSRPVDPKAGFVLVVEAAVAAARADDARREAVGLEPRRLFLRDDGAPKVIVRHTLRHTGITWLAETPGVDVEDVCSYAGITRAMFDRVYGHAHRARSRKVVAAQTRKPRKPKPKPDDDG